MRSGSEEKSTKQDIKVIGENKGGNDYVIADLHGNVSALKSVLKTLNKNDRLFIVGDLTDRGEDSPGVIEEILKTLNENSGQVNVIRGNHEDLTLNCINGLEKQLEIYANNQPQSTQDFSNLLTDIADGVNIDTLQNRFDIHGDIDDAVLHVRNGGKWLLELFNEEVSSGLIQIVGNEIQYNEEYEDDKYVGSRVKMIKDYMENLPYIMLIEGKKPFGTVHADMPDDYQNLLQKTKMNDFTLTENQKRYATWARQSNSNIQIKPNGRTEDSIITYVGHTIIDKGAPVLRSDTNTVNLDVAAYANNIILVVNHTKGTSQYISAKNNVDIDDILDTKPKLMEAQKVLDPHLKKEHTLSQARNHLEKLTNFIEENKEADLETIENNFEELKFSCMATIMDMEELNIPNVKKFDNRFETEYEAIRSLIKKIDQANNDETAISDIFQEAIIASRSRKSLDKESANKTKSYEAKNQTPTKKPYPNKTISNGPYPKVNPGQRPYPGSQSQPYPQRVIPRTNPYASYAQNKPQQQPTISSVPTSTTSTLNRNLGTTTSNTIIPQLANNDSYYKMPYRTPYRASTTGLPSTNTSSIVKKDNQPRADETITNKPKIKGF